MGFILAFVVGALLYQVKCHPDGDRQNFIEDGFADQNFANHSIPIERAPYVASIYLGRYHTCAASIIHEQFVLTVADCCRHPHYKELYSILVGTDKCNEEKGTDGQFFDVDEMIVHEKYDVFTEDFDVCLIKLKQTLTFGPNIGKIYLAKKGFNLSAGTVLNATGWKEDSDSESPMESLILNQFEIPLVAKKTCNKEWESHMKITPRMICAGWARYEQISAGNPLTLGDVQVGSSTIHAGTGSKIKPAVYTRVASVAKWIERKIEEFQ